MSYSYDDLKRVERRIQEVNALCRECEQLASSMTKGVDAVDRELGAALKLIESGSGWAGPDAQSCAELIREKRRELKRDADELKSAMSGAMLSALLDEVHRLQVKHARIYRELGTLKVEAGKLGDKLGL